MNARYIHHRLVPLPAAIPSSDEYRRSDRGPVLHSSTLSCCKRLLTFSLPGRYECLRSYKLLQVALVFHEQYTECVLSTCVFVLNLFRKHKHIFPYFLSFLNTKIAQIIECFSRARHWLTYIVQPMTWRLMSGKNKESGHQQTWYWCNLPAKFGFHHQMG